MLNIFFTIFIVILAYCGDVKVTRDKKMRMFVRAFLVMVMSINVMQMKSTDRPWYLYFYENEAQFYGINSFQDLLNWLSFDSLRIIEIGFTYLCRIFKLSGISGNLFLFIIAIVSNVLAINVLYKFKYPAVVFFLFALSLPYIQEANLIRQMLAVMIGFYATRYIEEKDWKTYLLLILLMFSIHRSSIVLLFLTPLFFVKEEHYKHVNYVLLGLWIISFAFVFKIIPSLDLGHYFMETRYENYMDADVDVGSRKATLNVIYNFMVLFYFVFSRKDKGIIAPTYLVLGCFLSNFAISAGQTMLRMALYFIPMYSAFVPTLLTDNKQINDKNKQTQSIALALLVLYYLKQMVSGV